MQEIQEEEYQTLKYSDPFTQQIQENESAIQRKRKKIEKEFGISNTPTSSLTEFQKIEQRLGKIKNKYQSPNVQGKQHVN